MSRCIGQLQIVRCRVLRLTIQYQKFGPESSRLLIFRVVRFGSDAAQAPHWPMGPNACNPNRLLL